MMLTFTDLVIGAGGEQHIEGRGMPQHQTHATLMEDQVDDGFREGSSALGQV